MKTIRMMVLSMVALSGAVVLPTVASAEPAAVTAPGPRGKAMTSVEARSLAQRQDQARGLEKYEGGQVVIAISTVGAIVIALVILLLVL